jgi:hypothetical protein|uniref:Uncharacterized protein n=1 Tax=Siphoviridae sp. ctOCb13 TaxID=2825477 RepID=A0A8S5Q0X0_9CAUD|nr:MAG TPA: hypothetical protein [Siphoviridae sp. ctOCb13]
MFHLTSAVNKICLSVRKTASKLCPSILWIYEINNVSLQTETVVAETTVVILDKHMKFFDRKEEIATLRKIILLKDTSEKRRLRARSTR